MATRIEQKNISHKKKGIEIEKTIAQHLSDAIAENFPWAEKAMLYTLKNGRFYDNERDSTGLATSKSEALSRAFIWEYSPEGHEHWDQIHTELQNIEKASTLK